MISPFRCCLWSLSASYLNLNTKLPFGYDQQRIEGLIRQGGRSCTGVRVAPAEKFGLGRKFWAQTYALLSQIQICRNLRTFWRSLGKKSYMYTSSSSIALRRFLFFDELVQTPSSSITTLYQTSPPHLTIGHFAHFIIAAESEQHWQE